VAFTAPVSDDQLQQAYETVERQKAAGSRDIFAASARELGWTKATVEYRYKRALKRSANGKQEASPSQASFPAFPDDDLSAEQILDHMGRRFEQRKKAAESLRWFEIKMPDNLPTGIIWFGDPHLGSNGCNVTLLRRDVGLASSVPGLYGANIGDTADNWGSKLVHLYASNDVSRSTERRLARWLLQDSGVRWLLWLEGNHDRMDQSFTTYLRTINANVVPMVDWRAKFKLRFPGGQTVRIDAAHDHKGSSMWNEMHGQERASMIDEPADFYIAGHRHTWGLRVKELADGRVVTLARARGYKWIDDHAVHHGFHQSQNGASILTVLDPTAKSPVERVRAFADAEEGAEYLTWKRGKAA
jgi:hypothetical protein